MYYIRLTIRPLQLVRYRRSAFDRFQSIYFVQNLASHAFKASPALKG